MLSRSTTLCFTRLSTCFQDCFKILYQSEGFPRTGYFIPAHVGSGAGQIWASFRRRRPAHFWQIWHMFGNQRFFHDWAPEKRSQRATTGKLLGIMLRVFFWKVQTPKNVSVSGDNLTPCKVRFLKNSFCLRGQPNTILVKSISPIPSWSRDKSCLSQLLL